MDLEVLAGWAARMFELAGTLVMVVGTLTAAVLVVVRRARKQLSPPESFKQLRRDLGAAILLGLELLVAADIIRTVTEDPSFRSVAVLAFIVLIRTFLSFTLEIELEGTLPWRRRLTAPIRSADGE